MNAEIDEDSEGTTFILQRGAAPSISQLEQTLHEVKALYNAKYGQDVAGWISTLWLQYYKKQSTGVGGKVTQILTKSQRITQYMSVTKVSCHSAEERSNV